MKLHFREFYNNLIGKSQRPFFIFGTNEYAKSVAEIYNVTGFIDEYTSEITFLQKPVFDNLDLVPTNALILSCSVANGPVTAINKIQNHNFECLDYFSFLKYSEIPVKPIEYWEGFEKDYKINKNKYDKIYQIFADNVSKEILSKLIDFRLSYDLLKMTGFTDIQQKQYFEDFLNLKLKDEVFVDVGGYDGYTSLEFIKYCPDYNHIYFFEPDEMNMQIAKTAMCKYPNIDFFEIGLSDKKERLLFENGLGLSSKISNNGSFLIKGDTIDNLIKDQVTYIKMDIEGSERKAIKGARNTILKYHPKLAISVYHKHDDLYVIPDQILTIRNDYQVFLRHYTEGVAETIMFFIPT